MLPLVRKVAINFTSSQLQGKLETASVPYAPVQRPDQLLDDPHLRETGQLLPTPMKSGKIGNLPKMPFNSSDYDFGIRKPPPGLGEHTQEVLVEAGFSQIEIDALISGNVVLSGAPEK